MKKNVLILAIMQFAFNLIAQSPILLKDINVGTSSSINSYTPGVSSPRYIVGFNKKAYFAANDNKNGVELWQSDGTANGTILLKDINVGTASSDPENFIEYNGALYFTANTADHGEELWKTDGTAAGTVLVKDIRPGATGSDSSKITVANGKLYFGATGENNEKEPHISDGTASGTSMLKDLPSIAFGSFPGGFIEQNGFVYFYAGAFGDDYGTQIWKTNGTESGTELIYETQCLSNLYSSGNYILFTAGFKDNELWKSDGTTAGTTLLINTLDNPKFFTRYNNKDFFISGGVAWETDGTTDNTKKIDNLAISKSSNDFNDISLWKNNLYFKATPPNAFPSNYELYSYNGTQIKLVKDIYTGTFGSDPNYFTDASKYFVFSADFSGKGTEVWKSDGTDAGTSLLADIEPGFNGSFPEAYVLIDGNLFFSATTSSNGREIYKIDISTGTKELLFTNDLIKVYPNPTNDRLNLELLKDNTNIQVELYDNIGNKINSINTNNNYSSSLNDLPKGLYILKINNGEYIQIEKLIKN